MNMNKTLENRRKVGGDNFTIKHSRRSNLYLSDYIDKFNFNDYWCFKSSGHQKLIDEEDFLKLKYSSYIFFKKDLYNVNEIIEWIDWCKNIGGIQFLDKLTPPFNPKKIIIKQ